METHKTDKRAVDILDSLIRDKRSNHHWKLLPNGTVSYARKAVYADILAGFSSIQEAIEYTAGIPDNRVIFTVHGHEIPCLLIRIIITDIEMNPWLSPFQTENPSETEMIAYTIPSNDLRRIVDKYGWWAARLAEAVCPYGDVVCVEREAKRLAETLRARWRD